MASTTGKHTSQTQSLAASAAPWLDRSTRAAQSMRAVEKLTDPDARREAFGRHMRAFPPLIGRL